jgi:hypothetical protein
VRDGTAQALGPRGGPAAEPAAQLGGRPAAPSPFRRRRVEGCVGGSVAPAPDRRRRILLGVAGRRTIGDTEGRAAVAAVLAPPAAAEQGSGVERAALRTAVRYTLQLLAQRAPGHAVEVRVPPLAAVQAVPGPVHRRGTPSAVVEMTPSTWLGLATGSLDWEVARGSGLVSASGERADLSAWLPLLQLGVADGH